MAGRGLLRAELGAQRGANATRVGALLFILSTALGVGVGVGSDSSSIACGLGWASASGALATALVFVVYRVRRSRHALMEAMHRLTGQ